MTLRLDLQTEGRIAFLLMDQGSREYRVINACALVLREIHTERQTDGERE